MMINYSQQTLIRLRNHLHSTASKANGKVPVLTPDISVGDLVFVKGEQNKNKTQDRL